MSTTRAYQPETTSRDAIDQHIGPMVVSFGTNWCGHCQAAQPLIEQAFTDYPGVEHLKIEDGKGRRLGRTFGVKLWPTLIFLRNGEEQGRVVRPQNAETISRELAQISSAN